MRRFTCRAALLTGAFCISLRLLAAQEAATIEQIAPRSQPHERPSVISAVAIAPGGAMLATAGDDHMVRLWNTSTGQLVYMFKGHDDWVRGLAFSPDGQTLVSAGDDHRVLAWRISTGLLHRQLDPHQHAVYAVAYSPDNRLIAVAGFANHVCLYDAQIGVRARELQGPASDLRSIAFSPDGSQLATAGRNGQIRVWAIATNKVQFDIAAGPGRIRTLAYLPDGRKLASAGEGRAIAIWDVRDGVEIAKFNCPGGKVLSMAVCGDNLIATGGSDNVVRVWNWQSAQEADRFLGHTGSVAALAYDPASAMLISGSFDTTVRVWRINGDAEPRATAAGDTQLRSR